MAKGSTHMLGNLTSAMCGVLQVQSNEAGAAWVAGSLFGILLSSDLDQIEEGENRDGGYYGQYVIKETFALLPFIGNFLERVWYKYWQVYSRTFKHRSFWTHFPPVCTLIRLIYALPYIAFFYLFLHDNFAYFIIALVASDAIHWSFDLKVWRALKIFRQ